MVLKWRFKRRGISGLTRGMTNMRNKQEVQKSDYFSLIKYVLGLQLIIGLIPVGILLTQII